MQIRNQKINEIYLEFNRSQKNIFTRHVNKCISCYNKVNSYENEGYIFDPGFRLHFRIKITTQEEQELLVNLK